ncbi:hypothetical protein DL98DRAFT_531865 [Cadophora sp. DSE1049]|nr:hypothetical protein DL98DRAFT_531865 [Cadophora sp. DSE1049]
MVGEKDEDLGLEHGEEGGSNQDAASLVASIPLNPVGLDRQTRETGDGDGHQRDEPPLDPPVVSTGLHVAKPSQDLCCPVAGAGAGAGAASAGVLFLNSLAMVGLLTRSISAMLGRN